MFLKYLHWVMIAACILLIASCFMPWAYYTDINQTFTGLYSYKNQYGRPGKLLILLAFIALICTLLPKIWAKRANLFVCALALGYAVKSYILFTSCYNTFCPETKWGLYVMMAATVLMMFGAVFPDMKLKPVNADDLIKTV